MAVSQTLREQIILTARKNPKLKRSDIAEIHGVSPNTASQIVYRAKRSLGDAFYLGKGKKPTPNTALVFGCLERNPNFPVKSTVIESKTGLTKDQVRAAANHLRNKLERDITRHSEGDCVFYVYKPQRDDLPQKPRYVDVFAMMNQLQTS